MMTQSGSEQATFQSLLERLFQESGCDDSLHKVRSKAWDHFLEIGLPTKKTEVFRYIKLRQLFSQSFNKAAAHEIPADQIAPYIYPECRQSVLVFVNGHYTPSLSDTTKLPAKVVISSLEDAARTYSALLNNHWAKSLKEETDPFAIINAALHSNGAFIYVPPKMIVEAPLQILHVIDTNDSSAMLLPRFHLFAGAQSQVNIFATHAVLSGDNYFINGVTDISVDDSSHVSFTQSACHESENIFHFDALRATLKKNANLKTILLTNGSRSIRNDFRVTLTGENSEASLNGIWMVDGKREAHTNILMDHHAPHCRSMQLFKGALSDFGRSSFEGKIYVRQAAQKTVAFQLNKNLLLSEHSHADSKPNLEIFADDVKASHGATVGQLDQDQLFYMKARGIDTRTAKNLLVYGFYQDVIDQITLPSMQQEVSRKIKQGNSQ